MAESIKQKLGFVVAAMMVIAGLAVLNLGSAGAQAKACGDGGGGGGTPSASPSPTESEEPFPPIPPIFPEDPETPSPSPSASDGPRKCSSDITLNYQGPSRKKPARRQFAGNVKSAEDECEKGRKVILKKLKKGKDKIVDTTVTDPKGGYKIPVGRANGRYYSQTPKDNVVTRDGRVTCGAAKSKPVKV